MGWMEARLASHTPSDMVLNQKHMSSVGTITNLAQQPIKCQPPYISKQALLDSETNIKCHCTLGNSKINSIKTVSCDSVNHELLRKFPDITKPPWPDQQIKHSVVHYSETTGRPVTAKARRLTPDRLHIAKAEFQNIIDLGHMQPSKSNYASPLHMVPKKDSTERLIEHSMLKLLKIIIAFPIF
ncbi:transposon Ty3-I Gag-Pol polyprotein [Trichonephila clavipes]|nr:transposon Ty3-I Gag-Pol polyprotein [Trichonephila clavipes]